MYSSTVKRTDVFAYLEAGTSREEVKSDIRDIKIHTKLYFSADYIRHSE